MAGVTALGAKPFGGPIRCAFIALALIVAAATGAASAQTADGETGLIDSVRGLGRAGLELRSTTRDAPGPILLPELQRVAVGWSPSREEREERVYLHHVALPEPSALASDFRQALRAQLAQHARLGDIIDAAYAALVAVQRPESPLTVAFIQRSPRRPDLIRINLETPDIEEVEIIGANGPMRGYLASVADRLRAERPLTPDALERYLLLFKSYPGVKASVELVPNDRGDGSRITMKVEFDRVDLDLLLSNQGPRGIGRELLFTTVSVNDVFTGSDYAEFNVINNFSPGSALFFDASYGNYINSAGSKIQFNASSSSIEPLHAEPGGDAFEIENRFFAQSFSHPLLLRQSRQAYVSAEANWGRARADGGGLPVFDEQRWASTVKLTYKSLDPWGGASEIELSAHRGWDVFGATSRGDRLATRGGSGASFAYFSAEANRVQKLTHWALLDLGAYAQTATESLLIFDQCTYGGRDYGRGFDLSVIFGDRCFKASGELQLSPDFLKTDFLKLKPYAFADGGAVEQIGALDPIQAKTAALMSAGGGVEIFFEKALSAKLEFAEAMRSESTPPLAETRRFYFQIEADF